MISNYDSLRTDNNEVSEYFLQCFHSRNFSKSDEVVEEGGILFFTFEESVVHEVSET